MTRYPVSRDLRYTVAKEYTGHISGKPVWVARFEGGWIASSPFYATAAGRAIGAHAVANGAAIANGVTA
jgi:hypothetical protein